MNCRQSLPHFIIALSCLVLPVCSHLYASPLKEESKYFLVILVDARHLNYKDNRSLLCSVAKHPSDGSKNGDVGHAWIYLQGLVNGESVYLEGGHSGERGILKPRYFDGVMNYIDYGVSDPRLLPSGYARYEPNPVKYLWEPLDDGFFQWGGGGHRPTYAARIELTPWQFQKIRDFIKHYPYGNYALVENQCSSFVSQVAALAGLDLECEITISIQPKLFVGGKSLLLWTDPDYATLTIASPDILEISLMQAVSAGKAKDALNWYQETHPLTWKARLHKLADAITRFPERYMRYLSL